MAHRGCRGKGRIRDGNTRRWRNPPPAYAQEFWKWVLTRLSSDEEAALRAWWLTNMARHNPTAEWAGSSGGRRGTWTGQEPEYMSRRHWSIRGAETQDDYACGTHLRSLAAAAECGGLTVGHADLQAAELRALISVLSATPTLRTGFMSACREGGERQGVAWLLAEIRQST